MINSISQFAATIAMSLGIEKPYEADGPIMQVANLIKANAIEKVDKVLIYNPDALGMWLYQKYADDFSPILQRTQLAVPVRTAFPPCTPVCFASMYTGAPPSIHGIQTYEKPVVRTDSLFDALIRAGKKAALVSTQEASLGAIFADRAFDQFVVPYDREAIDLTMKLIREGCHDVIVCYNQEYDDAIHETGCESPRSIQAMRNHIAGFAKLADAAKLHWRHHDTLICCATDHGIHDETDGTGTHGSDCDEDMNIVHFFGICRCSSVKPHC